MPSPSKRSAARPSLVVRGSKANATPVCKVAILGFGTVGSSVARILSEQVHAPLQLTHVCNRNVKRKKVDWLPAEVQWTESIDDILDSDVDVVVEVMGGLTPAGDWIRKALSAGKSVVTANKQLIARSGPELIALAGKMKRHIAYGASVAGGVPVISGLQEGLAGDELFKVCGILNGTCNFILSKIEATGADFDETLAEAQALGFAEADPTEDLEGLDARAKLAILARVGLRCYVPPESIPCRTIRGIEPVDFDYANQLGCTIRQISWAEVHGKHLLAQVTPTLVALTSPLARVQGSQNLVMATGKFGGETVFGGHGAGGNPTAVAIVSDIVAITRVEQGEVQDVAQPAPSTPTVSADFTTRHYLRFTVQDRPGIIAALSGIFEKCGINIDSLLQKPGYLKSSLPFVVSLEACEASAVKRAMQQIAKLDFLVKPCVDLPILD